VVNRAERDHTYLYSLDKVACESVHAPELCKRSVVPLHGVGGTKGGGGGFNKSDKQTKQTGYNK
jgi:hypothetical protein